MLSENGPLNFIDPELKPLSLEPTGPAWKLLIVDDDIEVHEATRFALNNVCIEGRHLQLIYARSASEAANILAVEPEIAVILLDVVMESPNAGLQLVHRIRQEFRLHDMRIILRTGQPGHAPEIKVIRDYDINDYKTKAELTHTRLLTTLIAAIRSYEQLRSISENRRGLERIINASRDLMQTQELTRFATDALQQLSLLLQRYPDSMLCVQHNADDEHSNQNALYCIAGSGQLVSAGGRPLAQLNEPKIIRAIEQTLAHQMHRFEAPLTTLYLRGDHHQAVLFLRDENPLTTVERQLLEIFAATLCTCLGNVTLVERLNYLAYHDPLTRLPNRTRFLDFLNAAAAAAPHGQVVSLLDIDRFADINNTLGYDIGDQLLIAVALRIACTYRGCQVARIGCDIFGILGSEVLLTPAHLLSVFNEPFDVGDQSIHITATVGLCRITESVAGDMLLKRADMALTRAHVNAHAGPLYFSQEMENRTHRRLDMLRHLRRDLHAGRLAVWYQPQVSMADGSLVGLEALARWPGTNGFTQPPEVFIPLAEESGLIIEIGAWVLDQSCTTFCHLQADGQAPSRIAINVSMPQMRLPDFPERVARTLNAHGMSASSLELEITESLLLEDPLVVLRNLQALKREGIQITIDDFGTGYSSLGYLRQLPIDCVKIDRSFVSEIDNGKGDLFAETIITLARRLGAETVAEGVTTQAQAQRLRQLGCDTVQGFLFAAPMPAEKLPIWISEHTLH